MLITALFAAFFTGVWTLGCGLRKRNTVLLCLALVLIVGPARLLFSVKWMSTAHELLVLGALSSGLVLNGWVRGERQARE